MLKNKDGSTIDTEALDKEFAGKSPNMNAAAKALKDDPVLRHDAANACNDIMLSLQDSMCKMVLVGMISSNQEFTQFFSNLMATTYVAGKMGLKGEYSEAIERHTHYPGPTN